MNAEFEGRVVLVAGGTGGLGRSVSLAFLREKAAVVATYHSREEFGALEQAAGAGSMLEGRPVDATDPAQVGRLIDEVVAKYGRLDVLVNAIGGYAGGIRLWEMEPKVLDQMLLLNLRAGFVLARAAVPAMLKQGRGAILNVASQAAIDHAAGASAYAASKAAAVALMDSLAQDLRGSGVRVNSVLPSIIDTEANRQAMPKADFAKWPKPEEIARVILFLCSDDADVIHGAAVPVYGHH
ncbi:MAG TPA: SDR family oxidoreductase [Acidobacteriaceae bacterium]|nr:SDR family oxidoreductase [Acidobacteriaceae bacterium]